MLQTYSKGVLGILVFLIWIFLSWYQVLESFYMIFTYAIHITRSGPLSMTLLWHHGSRLLSLIYGTILAYDIIIVIHLIGQWPLSLLSVIRAVYLIISNCTHMYKQYIAVYKTGLTAGLNNELSCSRSLIISTLSSLPLRSSYSFVVTKNLPES